MPLRTRNAPRRAAGRAVAAVLVAVALLVSMAACEPRTDNPQARIHCTVTGDPPERDSDEAPRTINAQVRFWCDKPGADSLTITLRLQRQGANEAWRDVAKSTFSVRRGQTIRTDTERYRTRKVAVRCGDGVYRTVVQGRSVARGKTKTYRHTGPRAVDPCRTFLH